LSQHQTLPPLSPLLSADPKAVLTFSAEKDGKLRVTYQGWEDVPPGGARWSWGVGEWPMTNSHVRALRRAKGALLDFRLSR
jgi:hypothetical protein